MNIDFNKIKTECQKAYQKFLEHGYTNIDDFDITNECPLKWVLSELKKEAEKNCSNCEGQGSSDCSSCYRNYTKDNYFQKLQ